MRAGGVKFRGTLRVSARRITAMVVAIGLHLGLLVALLRPVANYADTTPMVAAHAPDDGTALDLRFIPRPMLTPPASRALRSVARSPVPSRKALLEEMVPSPTHSVARATARPSKTNPTPPVVSDRTNSQAFVRDGSFQERLLNAQHAHDVHGVPGSDTPVAPGIQLIAPFDQGVGAVMRRTQRLFGITNHHCVDVEAWQHLEPDELAAQHLSNADLKRQADKYHCNRPLGLNF